MRLLSWTDHGLIKQSSSKPSSSFPRVPISLSCYYESSAGPATTASHWKDSHRKLLQTRGELHGAPPKISPRPNPGKLPM